MSSDKIICNGRSTTSLSQPHPNPIQASSSQMSINMNWLLHTLYARHDYEMCKVLIEKQLEENFDREYIFYVKGLIERQEGKLTDAIKSFQRSIEINPKNPDYYKEIGKTLHSMGKLRHALDVFLKADKLLQQTQRDPEIYHYIGELIQRTNKSGQAEAKDYFLRAVQNGRQNVDSYRKLAEIFIKENDYAKAIETLESSLSIAQETPELMTEIGILHLKTNDPQGAYDKLIKAVKIDDNSTKALLALGAVIQSKNDVDGALNRYKKIQNCESDGPELWSNLGLCFFKKQKQIAAIACLKKSFWISPLNYNVLYNLGLVLLAAQQYTSAFHAFATAINLRPQAECYMLIGVCLRKLNDDANAYLAFERSIMSTDAIKNPLIYLNFAIFCYELGREDQARLYLDHFYGMREGHHVSREYVKQAERLSVMLKLVEAEAVENKEKRQISVGEMINNDDDDDDVTVSNQRIDDDNVEEALV